jgi:hypothetical protein
LEDFDPVTETELAAWARARIAADTAELYALLKENGVLDEEDDVVRGLNTEAGCVVLLDPSTGSIYAPGPTTTLIGQTRDGDEQMWRDGQLVYDLSNPGAVEF